MSADDGDEESAKSEIQWAERGGGPNCCSNNHTGRSMRSVRSCLNPFDCFVSRSKSQLARHLDSARIEQPRTCIVDGCSLHPNHPAAKRSMPACLTSAVDLLGNMPRSFLWCESGNRRFDRNSSERESSHKPLLSVRSYDSRVRSRLAPSSSPSGHSRPLAQICGSTHARTVLKYDS